MNTTGHPSNFFLAVSRVGKFSEHCRRWGWRLRPAFADCIRHGMRVGLGMITDAQLAIVNSFVREWAIDLGGKGPQPILWSKRCTACGGRGPHEHSPGGHVYTTAVRNTLTPFYHTVQGTATDADMVPVKPVGRFSSQGYIMDDE